jgi:hypothetical protein
MYFFLRRKELVGVEKLRNLELLIFPCPSKDL